MRTGLRPWIRRCESVRQSKRVIDEVDLVQPVHDQSTAVDQWLVERKLLPKDHHIGFHALFLLVSWLIWKERNSRVFEKFATMPAWLLPKILDECNAWVAAGFRRIAPLVASWSQNGLVY